MRNLTIATCLGAASLTAADAQPPQLCIPLLSQVPTIDGQLREGEWDKAAEISAFIAPNGDFAGRVVPYGSRILLGHDGNRFYLAVSVELSPGTAPSMAYRRRDDPVFMDTHQVELWLTPPVHGQLETYQFIGNAYGAIFDVKQVPELGNVVTGWNANWIYRNHYEIGKVWTAELSVPFSDFTTAKPAPDEIWRLLCGVAWPQRAWPFTAGWYKNVPMHAQVRLSGTGTCARLEDVSPLFDLRLAPRVTVINAGPAGSFHLRATVGDIVVEQTLTVAGGATAQFTCDKPIPDVGKLVRDCDITVTAPDGKVLLAGRWPFTAVALAARQQPARPISVWQPNTRCEYAPIGNHLSCWADVLDLPQRQQLVAVRFTVKTEDGATVSEQRVEQFEVDAAETQMTLPVLPVGKYLVVIDYLDAHGMILVTKSDAFERKDLAAAFPWWGEGNKPGATTTLASPFTALESGGNAIAVWGRQMRFANGALPSSIISQGEEMLAAPVELVAVIAGREVVARAEGPVMLGTSDGVRCTISGSYVLPGLHLSLSGTAEYDGMLLWDLVAKPGVDAPQVERLFVRMSVPQARAKYFHSTAGGWSPAYGELDPSASEGERWTSSDIADFVPYVGISDDDRAIEWFADDDHGWVLGTDAPCARLVKRKAAMDLEINLVRKHGVASGFSARFGIIATPVRPLPRGWRNTSLDFRPHAGSTVNLFYGPGHGGCPIAPHDTRKLAEVLGVAVGDRDPGTVLAALPPRSGTLPPREQIEKLCGNFTGNLIDEREGRTPVVKNCYFFNAQMYFEGWDSPAFAAFFPGDWTRKPTSGWFHLTPIASYRDFFAFHMDIWAKQWALPGLYFDEVYLGPDFNLANGNGKLLADGTIRPRVPLLDQRAFLTRMRQVSIDNGKQPFLWVHTSNYMAPHAISAADVAMFGEDRAPNANTDAIDAIPTTLMRSIGRSQKFGFSPVWMVQAGRGDGSGPQSSFLQRQTAGWCWLHDTNPEYHTSSQRIDALISLRSLWGIMEDDVRFHPWWVPTPALVCADKQVAVSAWSRPNGKVLLLLMNLGRSSTTTTLKLDTASFALPATAQAWDPERGSLQAAVTARLAEVDVLMAHDPAAGKPLREAILADLERLVSQVSWRTADWLHVGQAKEFTLTIPARDFAHVILE